MIDAGGGVQGEAERVGRTLLAMRSGISSAVSPVPGGRQVSATTERPHAVRVVVAAPLHDD
jgi:hypothetical protein